MVETNRGFKVYPGTTPKLVYDVKPNAPWNIGGTIGGEAFAQTPQERFVEQYQSGMGGKSIYFGGMTPSQRRELGYGDAYEVDAQKLYDEFVAAGGFNVPKIPGLGGSGMSSADALALQKYRDERADRAAQQRALQQYLASGRLGGMSAAEEADAQAQYQQALANIAAGYGAAEQLTGEGYGGLEQYLRENQVNPYAGMTVNAGLVTNPMEQFLQAYGASSPDVQAAVEAEQLARTSGAGAFQNLIDVLSGAAGQAQTSRESEARMARTVAEQLLGQQRAGFESQAASARQAALAQIAQRQADREYAIEKALLELGVMPSGTEDGGGEESSGASETTRGRQEIAASAPNLKAAAREFAPKYMEKNPNATPAQIRKAFPKLAADFDAAKKK